MKRRITITFREEELDVDVFNYQYDPETNATELEWDFVGLTNEGREMLKITSEEEEKIETYLIDVIVEGWDRDDYDP